MTQKYEPVGVCNSYKNELLDFEFNLSNIKTLLQKINSKRQMANGKKLQTLAYSFYKIIKI